MKKKAATAVVASSSLYSVAVSLTVLLLLVGNASALHWQEAVAPVVNTLNAQYQTQAAIGESCRVLKNLPLDPAQIIDWHVQLQSEREPPPCAEFIQNTFDLYQDGLRLVFW